MVQSPLATMNQEVANSLVGFGTPSSVSYITSQNSQDSEVTVILNCRGQKLVDGFELSESESTKTYQEKEVQTKTGILPERKSLNS